MTASTLARPATPRQVAYLNNLRRERGLAPYDPAATNGARPMSASEASAEIDRTLATPRPAERLTPSDLEPGVYELDGTAYVVKYARQTPAEIRQGVPRRAYAKRVVEIGGTRTTEAGTFLNVEFVYDRGAVFNLRPEHKMDYDRARELTLKYGRCIVCGRDLRAGESVEQGIGPVCVRSFPQSVQGARRELQRRIRREARENTAAVLADRPEPSIQPRPPVRTGPLHRLVAAQQARLDQTATNYAETREEASLSTLAQRIENPTPADRDNARARAVIAEALDAYDSDEAQFALHTFDRLAGR